MSGNHSPTIEERLWYCIVHTANVLRELMKAKESIEYETVNIKVNIQFRSPRA